MADLFGLHSNMFSGLRSQWMMASSDRDKNDRAVHSCWANLRVRFNDTPVCLKKCLYTWVCGGEQEIWISISVAIIIRTYIGHTQTHAHTFEASIPEKIVKVVGEEFETQAQVVLHYEVVLELHCCNFHHITIQQINQKLNQSISVNG